MHYRYTNSVINISINAIVIFAGTGALQPPDQMESNGGVLSMTLNVQMAEVTIDWLRTFRRTFNEKIPGPTWKIKRGDRVTVQLVRI